MLPTALLIVAAVFFLGSYGLLTLAERCLAEARQLNADSLRLLADAVRLTQATREAVRGTQKLVVKLVAERIHARQETDKASQEPQPEEAGR